MRRKYTRYSKRIERNILAVYLRASVEDRSEGLHWYANANSEAGIIADKLGVTLSQSVGVIAAMSPGLNWGLNVLQADRRYAGLPGGDSRGISTN